MRTSLLSTAILAATLAADCVSAAARGLAWGADDRWAPALSKGLVTWLHHWENGPVSTLPSTIEYVPMYWGPKYSSLWANRVASFKSGLPKNILAFNEPDVASQANMTTKAAALYISALEPYRKKGVSVSSPQIVWNFDWMDQFLALIRAQSSDVDFIALHWYGSYTDIAGAKAYVNKAWTKYKKPIWVTEIGTTASSSGSNAQVRSFMMSLVAWLESQSFVDRLAWTGCYSYQSPPDGYLNRYGGFFNAAGTLRQIGNLYACNAKSC